MRRILFAVAMLSLAAMGVACDRCSRWPCAAGFVADDQCICHSIRDAATGDAVTTADTAGDGDGNADTDTDTASAAMPLASCTAASPCGAGSACIQGCPTNGPEIGVCSVPGRDTCGCGAVLDPCDAPGTVCLMPACCDHPGICVTPTERDAICARPEGGHFACPAF